MSGEVWAILGVVVGAVLGGGAQIVADVLRARRERAHDLRSAKRAAYAAVLAAEAARFVADYDYEQMMRKAGVEEASIETYLVRLNQATGAFNAAVAQVQLVAPDHVAQTAFAFQQASRIASGVGDEDSASKLRVARLVFLMTVKRDLGLPTKDMT